MYFRIKEARKSAKLTQRQLAEKLGIKVSTLSGYEIGAHDPKSNTLAEIARICNTTVDYLLGVTDSPAVTNTVDSLPANITPISLRKIPLLGGIAAGEPILAVEEYDTYVEADSDIKCDYALRVEGDSMEPTILYGDLVFIRQQPDVEDGEIAAVMIDEDATLKRVYHIPSGLQLISDNAAKYKAILATLPEHDNIRILGKAVALKRLL